VIRPRLDDESDTATGCGLIDEVRGFEFRPGRTLTRMEQLGSVRLAQETTDELVVVGCEFATIEPRWQLAKSDRRRAGLRAAIDTLSEIVERVETALHEPDLVGLRVERPGSAQHDQLHLGDGVTHALIGAQAIPGLQIGVEAIVLGPLRTGLVG